MLRALRIKQQSTLLLLKRLMLNFTHPPKIAPASLQPVVEFIERVGMNLSTGTPFGSVVRRSEKIAYRPQAVIEIRADPSIQARRGRSNRRGSCSYEIKTSVQWAEFESLLAMKDSAKCNPSLNEPTSDWLARVPFRRYGKR